MASELKIPGLPRRHAACSVGMQRNYLRNCPKVACAHYSLCERRWGRLPVLGVVWTFSRSGTRLSHRTFGSQVTGPTSSRMR